MTGLAIFVKTPGLSPVKSRLAESVGVQLAQECHLRCARTVAAVAAAAAIGPVYWAVAEASAQSHPLWRDLPILVQPEGGLGTRMQSIHDILIQRHGRGLLLGADLPQVEQSALQAASAWLEVAPARGSIGPAADGGFWMIGANCSLAGAAWNRPAYGTETVLRELLEADEQSLNWQRLAARTDLDRIQDLPAVVAELESLTYPHPEQLGLINWLRASFFEPHS
ncbi:MAG: DUF2064 domain-containing protein [Wenzhouxiangella sp.]|jgi:glycosyltransferase A (GT-A) superfamily protein (DUF2064 family)|nr:DUF2064 domain-containing protein [Wenzhouxiangella sp.]